MFIWRTTEIYGESEDTDQRHKRFRVSLAKRTETRAVMACFAPSWRATVRPFALKASDVDRKSMQLDVEVGDSWTTPTTIIY